MARNEMGGECEVAQRDLFAVLNLPVHPHWRIKDIVTKMNIVGTTVRHQHGGFSVGHQPGTGGLFDRRQRAGMGAVATTVIAGVEAIKAGLGQPIGSLTQMGTIRLGKRTDGRSPLIQDFVPLAGLDDLVFGGWDVFPDDASDSAEHAGVLPKEKLEQIRDQLKKVVPMPAVFDRNYVRRLEGSNVKSMKTKWDAVLEVRDDIKRFKEENGCERLVMIWCGSTEIFMAPDPVHDTIESLEKAIRENHEAIPPSMIYAYAALQEGIPYLNGAPNLTVDIPVMTELARQHSAPIAGKDFKTGQTLMKTIIAPGLKARLLGLSGWFSTNILGNRDGEVLDDPDSFKTKEESKLSVLEYILQPQVYPELYKDCLLYTSDAADE